MSGLTAHYRIREPGFVGNHHVQLAVWFKYINALHINLVELLMFRELDLKASQHKNGNGGAGKGSIGLVKGNFAIRSHAGISLRPTIGDRRSIHFLKHESSW